MKLRILGNKIRIRLTQQEVKDLTEGKTVSESVDFPGNNRLIYAVAPQSGHNAISAAFSDNRIILGISEKLLSGWHTDDREGLYHATDQLEMAIEKDFKCLHKRPGEDETDNFPNPLENKA